VSTRDLLTVLVGLAAAAGLVWLTGGLPEGFPTTPPGPPPATSRAPVAAPPGPLRADRAREVLPRLTVAEPSAPTAYRRAEFGSDWLDLDSDGCNTREEILARDMREETRPDGCNVETGTLTDPYTGQRISFTEDLDPTAVQIDHVIPLSRAWYFGAWRWSDDKRERFANDPLGLLAVDGPTNASKSDAGAGDWRPPNEAGWCLYSVRYVRMAAAYDLTVTAADVSALADMLGRCP
jgi:hypothetical protein